MKDLEFKKLKVFGILDINDYAPNSVVMKNIIKKASGNVNVISIDKGEQLTEKLSRFDHFIQIVEGKAEILVDDKTYNLNSGQCIIIPANSKNTIKANEKFKMISTIIKSGYE
ncbi:MAG: cupin domain-containing protein [Gelidibacter sp.]|uniref:cupin domain-containing protein n=1 Tax=Gelidibacter sp. TaxID=2018083 RepID=UPI0032667FA2